MKIKQIRLVSPELYLVTYATRWLKLKRERYVVSRKHTALLSVGTSYLFHFRETGENVGPEANILRWMIRNEIEFFDNTKSPDTDWPRGDRHQLCENCGKRHDLSEYCSTDRFSKKSGIPDKPAHIPPPSSTDTRHLRLLKQAKSVSEFSCYDCLNVAFEYSIAGNLTEGLYWYDKSKEKAQGKECDEVKLKVETMLKGQPPEKP